MLIHHLNVYSTLFADSTLPSAIEPDYLINTVKQSSTIIIFHLLTIFASNTEKTEWKTGPRFWRGSNSRPSACKADVITTTPQNQLQLQLLPQNVFCHKHAYSPIWLKYASTLKALTFCFCFNNWYNFVLMITSDKRNIAQEMYFQLALLTQTKALFNTNQVGYCACLMIQCALTPINK